jgi:hypothetical protein
LEREAIEMRQLSTVEVVMVVDLEVVGLPFVLLVKIWSLQVAVAGGVEGRVVLQDLTAMVQFKTFHFLVTGILLIAAIQDHLVMIQVQEVIPSVVVGPKSIKEHLTVVEEEVEGDTTEVVLEVVDGTQGEAVVLLFFQIFYSTESLIAV